MIGLFSFFVAVILILTVAATELLCCYDYFQLTELTVLRDKIDVVYLKN